MVKDERTRNKFIKGSIITYLSEKKGRGHKDTLNKMWT